MSDSDTTADSHDNSRTDTGADTTEADGAGAFAHPPIAVARSTRVPNPVPIKLYSVKTAERFRAANGYVVEPCDPDAAVEVSSRAE